MQIPMEEFRPGWVYSVMRFSVYPDMKVAMWAVVPLVTWVSAQDVGPYPDWETSEYILPFRAGEAYEVWQGNFMPAHDPMDWSHSTSGTAEGSFVYSYDFEMPIGTPIVAARAGRVRWFNEHHADGNGGFNRANFVLIEHDDGTYGMYSHLTLNGVVPLLFEEIEQGQLIGYSGNTGRTGGVPHLHFHVTPCLNGELPCDEHKPGTLPVTFRNTSPNPTGLQWKSTYRAEPFAEEPVEESEPGEEPVVDDRVVQDPLGAEVPILESSANAPLLNLSTRAEVVPGGSMHAGLVVGGTHSRTVLVRGVGPGLTHLGVAGAMVDPKLTVYQADEVVGSADNWNPSLAELFVTVGAFALPAGSRDAAVVLRLAPGVYSVVLQDANEELGGEALVEIYYLE